MSTPRPAATLLALMIATLPRPALWNPSSDTPHDHAALTRGVIATPDRAAHSVLAFSLLHTAASLPYQHLHTPQTPRTRSGASRAADPSPRLRGLRAGEPTLMMWISLPKTNLPAIIDGSTHTPPREGKADEGESRQAAHTLAANYTLARARTVDRAQLQAEQDNKTNNNTYHLPTPGRTTSMQHSGGRGGGQHTAPHEGEEQIDVRKRPAARTPEGGHLQHKVPHTKIQNQIFTTTLTHPYTAASTHHHEERLSKTHISKYSAKQETYNTRERGEETWPIIQKFTQITNITQVTSLNEVPQMPRKLSRNLSSKFKETQIQRGQETRGEPEPPAPQATQYNPQAHQGYNTYQPQQYQQQQYQPQQQQGNQTHPPEQHNQQQGRAGQQQGPRIGYQQAPQPEFRSSTIATVRDEDDLEQTFIKIMPDPTSETNPDPESMIQISPTTVSYTHLTLPTTPYV